MDSRGLTIKQVFRDTLIEFLMKYKQFYSTKRIWKCLQKSNHFVQALIKYG